MVPLMPSDSVEGGNDGGYRNLRRKRVVSSEGSRSAGQAAGDAIGTEIELAAVDDADARGPAGEPREEERRLLSSRSGDEEQLGFADDGVRDLARNSYFRQVRGLSESGEVEGADEDGGGGESRRLGRNWRRARNDCWRECRVPVQLLAAKRTRTIVFIYAVFSVRLLAVSLACFFQDFSC